MLSELQKLTCQAIVNIFETGRVLGDYGNVTVMAGDTGHLTYGRSQTTLASGNLYLLIKDYCEASGAAHGAALEPYLERMRRRDTGLDVNGVLHGILRAAGVDPVMRRVQDGFFDRVYWEPAMRHATRLGLQRALGVGVIYDSWIHGSASTVAGRVERRHGEVGEIGEEAWVTRYVEERREWLATRRNALLHRTVYRMDAFRRLIDDENWSLGLPIEVRGAWITREVLEEGDGVRASAEWRTPRLLYKKTPPMRNKRVERLQEALNEAGARPRLGVDGEFGAKTHKAVVAYQRKNGLKADGIVGPATASALDLG